MDSAKNFIKKAALTVAAGLTFATATGKENKDIKMDKKTDNIETVSKVGVTAENNMDSIAQKLTLKNEQVKTLKLKQEKLNQEVKALEDSLKRDSDRFIDIVQTTLSHYPESVQNQYENLVTFPKNVREDLEFSVNLKAKAAGMSMEDRSKEEKKLFAMDQVLKDQTGGMVGFSNLKMGSTINAESDDVTLHMEFGKLRSKIILDTKMVLIKIKESNDNFKKLQMSEEELKTLNEQLKTVHVDQVNELALK